MSDESGQYVKLKNSGGVWLPLGLLTAVILTAIAWGTNANRLATVEQHGDRMEVHLSATDQQIAKNEKEIALLQYQLAEIQRLLEQIDLKLQRAEEERRK